MEFEDNDAIDSYVKSKNYRFEGMLCMSFGFDKFAPETHTYEFTQRFYPLWIPQTRFNQVLPTTILYDEVGYQLYSMAGYT
jgi:hypothetical protein